MTDTSLIFNILAKDSASQAFGLLKIKATEAFDAIAERAFDFAKETVDAFAQGERSQLLLEDAFAKFPGLADTNIEHLRSLNEELQKSAKYDHNAIAEGEAKLAMFKFTGSQIEALTPLLEDFASKTGMGLSEAATVFGKSMIGQARGLKQVGINFKATGDEAKDFATLMADLKDKVGGFAEKEGNTAIGKTQILKNEMEDLKEKIGAGLVPVLLKVVPPLMQTLDYFNKNSATLTKVLAIVGSVIGIIWLLNAAVRAYTTVQIALNIAMSLNPVALIIIAIVALVAVFVLLWTHSAGFRDFFIGMWKDIRGVLDAVGAWFSGPFVNFFKAAGADIVGVAKDIAAPFVWLWQNVLYPGFTFAQRIISSFVHLFIDLSLRFILPNLKLIAATVHVLGEAWSWLYDNVLTPVGHGIMTTVQGIGAVWTWLWQHAIGPAIDLITAGFRTAWGWWSAIFDAVMGKVRLVGGVFGTIFGAIGGYISAAFNDAVAVVKWAINGIIGLINAAVGFINRDVIDKANSLPGVNFPHLAQIPKLDMGGTIAQTGLAIVHKGETVTPAGRSAGGEVTVRFDFTGADQEFARFIRKTVRVQGGTGANSVQVAFGARS